MRVDYINRRHEIVDRSLILPVEIDDKDIQMDVVFDDKSIAQMGHDEDYWGMEASLENRLFLEENVSNLKMISPSFKVMYFVELIIGAIKNGPHHCSDYNLPLYAKSKNTKGEFAKHLKSVFESHLIPKVAEDEILNCLYNFLGDIVNLPIKLTESAQSNQISELANSKRSATENNDIDFEEFEYENAALSMLDEYCRDTARYIEVDQCVNDCFVYAGDDNISLMRCPICSEFRYRPCTRSKCEGKKKISSECHHLLVNDGIPFKRLFYRFLIPNILDLIDTDYFLSALEYQTDLILRDDSDLFYNDFSDGSVAKEQLTSMRLNFDAWVSEDNSRIDSTPVNLLLLQFYDAGQIFKWRSNHFVGLFTGILNLPPSYRGKIGISNFAQALFCGKHASAAEKFIFIDCYCEELRSLYVGYEYVANNLKKYFIQARLIFHSLDTRGVEPSFGLKSMSNSLYGCPSCRKLHGISDSWKTNFIGHRYFLPEDNVLRFFGQSGKCCPSEFYNPDTKNAWFIKENFLSSTESILATDKRFKSQVMCVPCNGQKLKPAINAFTWSHKDPRFKLLKSLKKKLFFRHLDLRKRAIFDIISKEDYTNSALQAERDGVDVHGIKFLWPCHGLPYSDFMRHYSFPVYHVLNSIVSSMIEFMVGSYIEKAISKQKRMKKLKIKITPFGKRSTSKKMKRRAVPAVSVAVSSSKKRKRRTVKQLVSVVDSAVSAVPAEPVAVSMDETFVPIYKPSYVGTTPPYSARKEDYLRTIARLSCVLLPEGSSSNFKINIKDIGQLKMEQKVILVTVYWDFIIHSLASIDKGYQTFYSMFGADIRKVMSLRIKKDSIIQLQSDVIESVCVWEAIFPVKENSFQLHELIHLVHSIQFFGSPAILNDLSGERSLQAIKKIKKLTNPGGTSFERMVFRRHMFRERIKMECFYAEPINSSVSAAPNHHTKVIFDPDSRVLTYKSFSFHIFEDKNESFQCDEPLSAFEINNLVKVLLREVQKCFHWDEEKCLTSPLYRISKFSGYDIFAKFQNVLKTPVYSEDICRLADEFLNMKPISHRKAVVYGIPFKGRGINCRETEVPSDIRYGAQSNKTRKHCLKWFDKKEYSSWCRFSQKSKPNSQNISRYGQINAFFKLNISDPVLNGILIASVSAYKFGASEGVETVLYNGALDATKLFVSLQDIHPTQVATIPFTGDHFALSKRFSGVNGKFVKYFGNSSALAYYVMLIMQPENLSLYPDFRPLSLQKH
jgi:hypothetical protein